MNNKSQVEPLRQIPLLGDGWQPKKGQPLPWEIKRKLFKPKGGRNRKGADNNFHNRDYDFVSPDGEVFTGRGVRQFAQKHGLNENCLLDLLNGRLHSHKGWEKAIGGRKLPISPTYYFLSPKGVIYTTTNLTHFAHEHGLCAIALSRLSRCIIGTHRGWHHCDKGGNVIKPCDKKHRKFKLLSPAGEIVEGCNLKAFAEENKLTRTCLMNVLDGTSKEHKGWKLPDANAGDLKVEKFYEDKKDAWNPADFGDVPHKVEENGQATIFFDVNEPPEPDDFETVEEFEEAWQQWENLQDRAMQTDGQFWRCKHGLHPTIAPTNPNDDRFICCDKLPVSEQIALCQERIKQQRWRIDDLKTNCKNQQERDKTIASTMNAIAFEEQMIFDLELSEVPQGYEFAYRQLRGKMGHDKAVNLLSRQR